MCSSQTSETDESVRPVQDLLLLLLLLLIIIIIIIIIIILVPVRELQVDPGSLQPEADDPQMISCFMYESNFLGTNSRVKRSQFKNVYE